MYGQKVAASERGSLDRAPQSTRTHSRPRERWPNGNAGHCIRPGRSVATRSSKGGIGDPVEGVVERNERRLHALHMDRSWSRTGVAVVNSVGCSIVCGGLLAHAAWILGDSRQPGMGDAQMVGWPPPGIRHQGMCLVLGLMRVEGGHGADVLVVAWGLWLLTTLHGQWQELDAALTEQVNSGWLSGQERLCILDHLDRTGAPIALEEAWAIQGLTHAAASLDAERGVATLGRPRPAPGHGSRPCSRGAVCSVNGCALCPLEKPGKWGLRWDHGAAAVTAT